MTILEPFGTTPFPILTSEGATTPYRVTFDPSEALRNDNVSPQQPQTQQIAVFEAIPNEESINGASVLAVNQHFVCYAVKNGLIRILHRHSTLRTLLRAHSGQRVTDIKFFQDGDVLATAGNNSVSSRIVIWRVFERSPEIMSEKLLEIETSKFSISRVLWHPFNPNQFWMVHRDQKDDNVATLVETTRIATIQHPTDTHALCKFYQDYCIMKDAVQLKPSSASHVNLTDLCWNGRDTRHVLAVYDSGQVILWDLRGTTSQGASALSAAVTPLPIGEVRDDSPGGLSRCIFLPHEDSVLSIGQGITTGSTITWTTCFITASQNNSSLTLWSAWSSHGTPTRLQTINIVGNNNPSASFPTSSYILDLCFGPAPPDASPPSCFIVAADREAGRLFAFHCRAYWSNPSDASSNQKKALLAGCDYVVPFATKHPTYAWSVICAPTQDISEEELSEQGGLMFDMKLFSYQSTVVQCLTLTSYMCLPPASTWTDPTLGVTVEPLERSTYQNGPQAVVSDFESDDDVMYDEDYDVDDDDDAEDADFERAPEASALPPPDGISAPESTTSEGPTQGLAQNPFANWLGAIAAKSLGGPTPPLPPIPPAQSTSNSAPLPPPPPSSFLSPMEILSGQAEPLAPTPYLEATSSANAKKEGIFNSRDPTPTATNKQQPVAKEQKQQPKGNEKSNAVSKDKIVSNKKTAAKQAAPKVASLPGPEAKISILKRDVEVEATSVAYPDIPVSSPTKSDSETQFANAVDEKVIRRLVREEVTSIVVPAIRQAITDSLGKVNTNVNGYDGEKFASSIAPLQVSIDAIAKQGVQVDIEAISTTLCDSVHEPIRAAFADSMKNVLIPTLESITSQVFGQISEQIEKSGALQNEKENSSSKDIESMSTQLSTMTQLVAKLTEEVQSLRREVAASASLHPASHPGRSGTPVAQPKQIPPVDPVQVRRNEILSHIREKQYDEAFRIAVSATTPDMVLFCCRNCDLNEVLGGATPVLSQPILLCLMQQLGTILVSSQSSNLQLEMDWLQEIALSLNPADASIHRHVPGVFQQVVNNINQKLKLLQGTDQNQLRRDLQRMLQLMRGMSIGSSSH